MKLYSYIVARDFGFAPNPFYGFCTLATCKPKIAKDRYGWRLDNWHRVKNQATERLSGLRHACDRDNVV